jgi:hypothetical protein
VLTLLLLSTALLVPIGVIPAGERDTSVDGAPFGQVTAVHAQAGLPPLPAHWPATLQLGRANGLGATPIRSKAPFGFRYQYLAAGVNTGSGWQTWQEPSPMSGLFVTRYIQESVNQGLVPAFSYYMIYQSLPGSSSGEQQAVITNLNSTATMQAYWADLRVFFQRAGASPFADTPVVFHVEPDMWGYVQQWADLHGTRDNAASVGAKVNATGVPEVAGLPDTVAGLAQGIVRMRNQYAPNVILGYHASVWGTNTDIAMSDPSDSQVDALGNRAGAFYGSLGASFDVSFGEFSDRDSAYMLLQQGKGPQSWWNGDDFRRHVRFISRFVVTSGTRMVLWQIPYGNTRMRAMNNTTHHYQDNRVEWLLDEPARTHLTAYVNAGAIGFLWGGGNGEVTDASDAAGDGTTDPAPIDGNPFTPFGNTRASLSAEDDGGYFHERAAAYYTAGAMSLPAGAVQTPTPTPTPGTPTATPVPAVACSPRPPVQLSTTAAGGGLQVSVTATGQNNRLLSLQIAETTNALVDVAGQTGRTGVFSVNLPGTSTSTSFTILRAGVGPATVRLAVVDRCGSWTTFVGGGVSGF